MKLCLRIALWVFLLFGYFQASPIRKHDLHFTYLEEKVKCNENVTFASPTYVQNHSYGAAMETFREGLKQAQANCTDKDDRIELILEALENGPKGNATEGTWERKKFMGFVIDLKTFINQLQSNN